MSRISLLLPAVLAVVIIIPILIGIYVYRDAKLRRMNAILWTVIAVAAPSLIGFIIYLLVRSSHSDLVCPKCGAPVTEDYLVCPSCGVKLRLACPSCAAPVEPDWVACPKCAAPLSACADSITVPIPRQDKSLWRILAVTVAVPLLLIGLLTINFSGYSGGGTAGMHEITLDEYFEQQMSEDVQNGVFNWLVGLDRQPNHAYALQYASGDGEGGYSLLLFVPGAGKQQRYSFGHSTGLFGPVLTLELEYTGDDGSLFCVEFSGEHPPRLEIELSGKKIPCDVTAFAFDPFPS